MELSITTDYAQDTGTPEPYLEAIAAAGFSHVHWCHQWNTDFLYAASEIEQIRRWLSQFGLGVLDLHGSAGREKDWAATEQYQRLAGVELVRNRLMMAAQLGGDVVIMHLPRDGDSASVRRSLDELEPTARQYGVRIALENGEFDAIEATLNDHSADYLGLCYDSGHGNLDGVGLDRLETLASRLISVHLHDNDGSGDQHNPLFSGTVDWPRLARVLAASSYRKCVSMEVTAADTGFDEEQDFLAHVHDTGRRFAEMVRQAGAGTTRSPRICSQGDTDD